MPTQKSIREDYIFRINKVIRYIEKNLNEELSLNKLAEIAYFSPFHFHRIFYSVVGETTNVFINRLKIERIAAAILAGGDTPISELSAKYGFINPSSFSRAFKKYYGISASEFKKRGEGHEYYSKIRKVDSKNGKEEISFERYIRNINYYLNYIDMNAKIEIKQMPELQLAGISHVGEFDKIGMAYEKLMKWAGPKGLFANPDFKTVTIYHDDPKVTEISKVRQSACCIISEDFKGEGEISSLKVDGGKFAVGRFEVGVMEFEEAWNSMCVWVAENGYKERDGDYYELYHNDHMQHPEKKFILDICVPVK